MTGSKPYSHQVRLARDLKAGKDVAVLAPAAAGTTWAVLGPAPARLAAFACIEGWYNPGWHHSVLGYLPPIAFEQWKRVPA